jgi:ribosomal protein L9
VYGGIAEHEIISAIKREYGVELEKKNILLPNGSHIKKTGSSDIRIHITEDSYIRMAVIVSLID